MSYSGLPAYEPQNPDEWREYVKGWLADQSLEGDLVVLAGGPWSKHTEANHRAEIIDLT